MDPQRQYAQLLTLWSQGSKIFRRAQHLDSPYNRDWDAWWRIGRRLVERGLAVLPVPAGYPCLLVGADHMWFTLCPERHRRDGVAKGDVIGLSLSPNPALQWDAGWVVSQEMASRMGQRGWTVLVRGPRPSGAVSATETETALTVLGALNRRPELFKALDARHWISAAFMLRHPGTRLLVDAPLPESWGFRYDAASNQAWWERQDEDSVH